MRWTDTWSDLKGTLYLGEIKWLSHHLGMKLFKLGRLQFCMGRAETDIPSANLLKGDRVMEIHIPACGPLKYEECMDSIEKAKAFFAEYFPEFEYKCFTCHSWLLDRSLEELLGSKSNIIRFQSMFDIVSEEKSDAILKYVFKWNTTRDKLKDIHCTEGFPGKVKSRIASGGDFFEAVGIIKK